VKLEDNLKQIEKRIAELQRKAEWIKLQLPSVSTNIKTDEVLIEAPRRRGRRKLNETE
jgi:hypothetical protein